MGVAVNYNPDILSCLANLSNDEVFTPPELVNRILDMLPSELWSNPDIRVLDPCSKSGVFLREIAKRMIEGEKDVIPDLQERIDHIFHKQLYGIAITELTSLLSRRSLYCSKMANGQYSVSQFKTPSGNIIYRKRQHTWDGNGKEAKCIYCGASRDEYGRSSDLESYAYEFIHLTDKEFKELSNMHFDLIISNPPYQLSTGSGKQAKPIYHLFVEQAKKLQPRYLTMIIPSRWFAGGMGLDKFRNSMMQDDRISKIVDYSNAKDCFPQNSISGGVCYFLWARDKNTSTCEFVGINSSRTTTMNRPLNEFPVLVRYNQAINIIRKIQKYNEKALSDLVSPISPFGLPTHVRGEVKPSSKDDCLLHASTGTSYIPRNTITTGTNYIDKYKVLLGQASAEHAGEPGKDGRFRVLTSSMKVIGPSEVCTHSYILLGTYSERNQAENLVSYLRTCFVRFLLLQALTSIHISRQTFYFVPLQDFSKPWTDEELYKKYNLTDDEIAFIESMIRPMDSSKMEA